MSATHTIHRHRHHHGWDHSIPAVATVAPGESVELETIDAFGAQLPREATAEDVARIDFAKINPVTGPIVVDGAEPGDALAVTVLDFTPSGVGWTANIPGFGLLADAFPDPAVHNWTWSRTRACRRRSSARPVRSAGTSTRTATTSRPGSAQT